jgi:hypothetical protein
MAESNPEDDLRRALDAVDARKTPVRRLIFDPVTFTIRETSTNDEPDRPLRLDLSDLEVDCDRACGSPGHRLA